MKKLVLICLLTSCKVTYHYDIEVVNNKNEVVQLTAYSPNIGLRNGCITIDSIKMFICGIKNINSIIKVKNK